MTQNVPAGRGSVAGRPSRTSNVGPTRRVGPRNYVPPLLGLATIVVIAGIFALAVGLFQGSFTETVPVTVISQRAGLVMNPDAKAKMRGVQVGKDADLMIVKGNPVTHITDIENVEIVIKDGTAYDSGKLLESVKGRYGQY